MPDNIPGLAFKKDNTENFLGSAFISFLNKDFVIPQR